MLVLKRIQVLFFFFSKYNQPYSKPYSKEYWNANGDGHPHTELAQSKGKWRRIHPLRLSLMPRRGGGTERQRGWEGGAPLCRRGGNTPLCKSGIGPPPLPLAGLSLEWVSAVARRTHFDMRVHSPLISNLSLLFFFFFGRGGCLDLCFTHQLGKHRWISHTPNTVLGNRFWNQKQNIDFHAEVLGPTSRTTTISGAASCFVGVPGYEKAKLYLYHAFTEEMFNLLSAKLNLILR